MDDLSVSSDETTPRRVGEVIGSTVGTLASVVNYPLGTLSLLLVILDVWITASSRLLRGYRNDS